MKRHKNLTDRLILLVVKHRSNATVRKIARSGLTGADLAQAKREAADFVVFERACQNGKQKRSQTARLTAKGIWQAIRLTSGYDPALASAALAAVDIRAVLARLEAERNPLAVELAGYRHDAQAFRQQEANRKECDRKAWEMVEAVQRILARPRHKLSPRHYKKLNAFLVSRGIKPRTPEPAPAQAQPAFGKILPCQPSAPSYMPLHERENMVPATTTSTQASGSLTDSPPALTKEQAAEAYRQSLVAGNLEVGYQHRGVPLPKNLTEPIYNRGQNELVKQVPTLTVRTREGVREDPAVAERIKARIRAQGYGDAIEGEKVRFDNRLISFAEWERQNPEN